MAAYWISVYQDIFDESKLAAYAKLAGPALEAAGGTFLGRGLPDATYEAGEKTRTVLIKFDSVEAARGAHDSPAYQEALAALDGGAKRDIRILPGVQKFSRVLPNRSATTGMPSMIADHQMIGDAWGVRDDEIARRYPCDDFVTAPTFAAYRGVNVNTPPAQVWPWVAQIRLGPYSYDWIDNLGRRSPRELKGLSEPLVGENFSTAFGRPAGRIVSVTAGEALSGQIGGFTMSYILVPEGLDTRLLLKVVSDRRHLFAPLLSVADLAMARRQLLNIKRLAEGHR